MSPGTRSEVVLVSALLALGTAAIKMANGQVNQCKLDDIVATTLQELGSIALISEVSGPCITREKGYQASRTQEINIFFPDLKNDLSGSYCFGFLVNTDSDNTEPLVHFFSQDPITLQYDITGNCTITSDTIELTIRGSTVTFTGLETGGYKRYQLCTDGSTMTLYDDCGVSQSKSFSHAGFSGTLEGIGVMVDPDLTSLYAGSVVQFYFLSCTGPDVADMVALQCKSNPLNCSEPVISLAAVVQEYKTHTSPGVSTLTVTPTPTLVPLVEVEKEDCSDKEREVKRLRAAVITVSVLCGSALLGLVAAVVVAVCICYKNR